jgi:hypothetical protein
MPKPPHRYTPRRRTTVDGGPTSPAQRGRVIQLRVSATREREGEGEGKGENEPAGLVDAPEPYAVHSGKPSMVIDADAPAAPTSLRALRPSERERSAGSAAPGRVRGAQRGAPETPATHAVSSGQSSHSLHSSHSSQSASEVAVQTLITSAVTGWCAVIHERMVYSLHIAPLSAGVFEVEATLALPGQPGVASEDLADRLNLRVSCWLGRGKMVRTEVEPLAPGRSVV